MCLKISTALIPLTLPSSFSDLLYLSFSSLQMFALHLGSKSSSNLDMIKQTRMIVDEMNTKFGEDVAFMYGFPFLFFEQYLHSYRDLYLVVGLALGKSVQPKVSHFKIFRTWLMSLVNASLYTSFPVQIFSLRSMLFFGTCHGLCSNDIVILSANFVVMVGWISWCVCCRSHFPVQHNHVLHHRQCIAYG